MPETKLFKSKKPIHEIWQAEIKADAEKAFDLFVREKYKGTPQRGKPSYYPRKVPYDGYIDHQWDQSKIERFIRAMTFQSKPCAKAMLNSKEIEINDIDTYLELFS